MTDPAIRSAVTVSLVEQARGGPFVFWDDLPQACLKAAGLGFDAVELFMPGADAVDPQELRDLLKEYRLQLAAVGTGAGWVIHKLQLVHPDEKVRQKAIDFIRTIIDFGAAFNAPAIIGSMQGRSDNGQSRDAARTHLQNGLAQLADHAAQKGAMLLIEPLNRYESNMLNTIADGVEMIEATGSSNLKMLADLFHMNIEENDIPAAIRASGGHIGHVHFVDSQRRPAGTGHLDLPAIAAALRDIDYIGYASAEALPHPTPEAAAAQTIESYRHCFA